LDDETKAIRQAPLARKQSLTVPKRQRFDGTQECWIVTFGRKQSRTSSESRLRGKRSTLRRMALRNTGRCLNYAHEVLIGVPTVIAV
jgi:hypothetical protein